MLAKDAHVVLVPEVVALLAVSILSVAFPILRIFAYLLLIFFLFSLYFFRDPERKITKERNAVLSPVDGKVIGIEKNRLIIFLSPFDVHVSRAPVSGKITGIHYHPGKFLPAFLAGASENERELMEFKSALGKIAVVRIAGIAARRIVTWVRKGDDVSAGERIGMIRFGSRCEITIPKGLKITVSKGVQLYGGVTVIARKQGKRPR